MEGEERNGKEGGGKDHTIMRMREGVEEIKWREVRMEKELR